MPPPKAPLAFEQYATFGDLLKYLRRRSGLTQRELATAVGYSDTHISRLEQNQRLPDLATVTTRLAKALGIADEPAILHRLVELAETVRREDAPAPGLPPFKGLYYFDEADAELFFGREALTERLRARLLETCAPAYAHGRFLAVTGASGSGKSSVIRAGLVPALRWSPATAGWPIYVMTPTAHPMHSLRAALGLAAYPAAGESVWRAAFEALTHQAGAAHAVLVVDQFEEVFTLCASEAEREAFIAALHGLAYEPEGSTLVVIGLRADFYAHCARYSTLREALAHHQEYIGAMDAGELRRAIEEPARNGHWELEAGLVDLLLREVGATDTRAPEPGALPLLSHALLETWQRRRGHTLTLSGYAASGGVRGAIAETAEAVFQDQLNARQRAVARHVFLQMTELGEDDTVPDTRRRAALRDLAVDPGSATMVRDVLTLLADARLIITDEETAEVAHEALIREWPTLREWLNTDREELRLHRHLAAAAHEWERLGRDPSWLYRGARLAQASEWAKTNAERLRPVEAEFVEASAALAAREEAEREAQRQRELAAAQQLAATEKERAETQRQRAEDQARAAHGLRLRSRLITVAGLVALALAGVAATFALQANASAGLAASENATAVAERERADQQAAMALGAEATAAADRDRADEQADRALQAEATAQVARDLAEQSAVEAFSRELAVQAGANLAVDPERSILLALAALEAAPVPQAFSALQAATQASRVVWTADPEAGVLSDVAFSPDGRTLITGGEDGVVRVWDAATGQMVQALEGHTDIIGVLDLTRDGRHLATGSNDGTVRIWDLSSGESRHTLDLGAGVWSLDFSPDGQRLAVAAGPGVPVILYDVASGREAGSLSHPDWETDPVAPGPGGVVYSPDGTRLAIALDNEPGAGGPVEIWDTQTGERLLVLPERISLYRNGLDFSPDGTRLATARSADPTLGAVWDAATGERLFSLSQGGNRIRYSADGQRLLMAAGGAKAGVWDAATGRELLILAGHTSLVEAVAESPECAGPPEQPFEWCGRWLATVSWDGTLRLWDVSPMGAGVPLTVPGSGPFGGYGLSADGQIISNLAMLAPHRSEWLFQQWRLPDQPGGLARRELSRLVRLDPGGATFPLVATDQPGRGFTVVYETGRLHALDLAGATVADFCCVDVPVSAAQLSGDLRRLVLLRPEGVLELWDTDSETRLNRVELPELPLVVAHILAVNHDGSRAAVLLTSGLHVLDPGTGEPVLDAAVAAPPFEGALFFSRQQDAVLVMDCSGTLTVVDLASGQTRLLLQHSGGCFLGADMSPDGRLLAASTLGGALRVWNTQTSEVVLELQGSPVISRPHFSPDGRFLYGGSLDVLAPDGGPVIRAYFTRPDDLVAFARERLTRGWTEAECQQYLRLAACP